MGQKTVVVTGGAGFVGRHLLEELHRADTTLKLVVWDRGDGSLPSYASLIPVDITDVTSYAENLSHLQPSWVIHLAAIASVVDGLQHPEKTIALNVTATQHLLETIDRVSPHTKVLAVSSADIYGQGSKTPLPELPLSQADPQNPYAVSKWQMEDMIEKRWNSRVIRVRPFPHIGPGQRTGFVAADFASQIAAIEAGNRPAVIQVGNLEAYRDFTDVRDVVRAYRLLLEAGTLGEVYHVASGTATKIQTLLQMFLSLSSQKITIQQDADRMRPSDIPILLGDASKLRTVTGWQPTIPLSKTVEDTLTFWRSVTV